MCKQCCLKVDNSYKFCKEIIQNGELLKKYYETVQKKSERPGILKVQMNKIRSKNSDTTFTGFTSEEMFGKDRTTLQTQMEKLQPSKCIVCFEEYDVDDYEMHKHSLRLNSKMYVCVCNKRFAHKWDLHEHIRGMDDGHNGEESHDGLRCASLLNRRDSDNTIDYCDPSDVLIDVKEEVIGMYIVLFYSLLRSG